MKRYLLIHLSFLVSFFILVTLLKNWLDVMYLPFWIGGIIGFFLPDIDYLVYNYFLKGQAIPSIDTVVSDVTSKNVVQNWATASETREDKKLIFHTAHFQLIFILFTFFVLTSSSSLLGRGIVLAFSLHLWLDLAMDWKYKGTVDHWFRKIPYELDTRQKKWYVIATGVVLLLFGFFF